jgi:hypothetical protein
MNNNMWKQHTGIVAVVPKTKSRSAGYIYRQYLFNSREPVNLFITKESMQTMESKKADDCCGFHLSDLGFLFSFFRTPLDQKKDLPDRSAQLEEIIIHKP